MTSAESENPSHDSLDGGIQRAIDELLIGYDPAQTKHPAFFGRQFDLGLAWAQSARGCGGLGLPSSCQRAVDARLTEAGAPAAFQENPLGIGMVAPAIHEHGDDEQRARYLRALFTGEEIWCQLFSEPDAGSDLASVACSAVRDGDTWKINGQKVWTSYAHRARRGLLLARTSTAAKHAGLTTFLLDMTAPGVEVRPLFQMTGEAEFNEVYLTDVLVPDIDRLGPIGAGWDVTRTTLLNERVAIGDQVASIGEGIIASALKVWREVGDVNRVRTDRLVQLWIRAEALRFLNVRLSSKRGNASPGPEGSMAKVISARLNQDIAEFELHLLGVCGLLKPSGYPLARSLRDPFAYGDVAHDFLRSQANSIEGGTSTISKNILAERVLKLPKAP